MNRNGSPEIGVHRITDVYAEAGCHGSFSAVTIRFGRDAEGAALSVVAFTHNHAKARALADAINAAGFSSLPAEEEDEPEPETYDDALATKLGREDALDRQLHAAGRGHLAGQ